MGAILRPTMDDFLEQNMARGMLGQIGKGHNPLKVSAMTMQITRNNQGSLGRK